MLDGFKTYIFGALAVISGICYGLGWIDIETLRVLLSIFVPAEGMALRRAISKK
jgi:hypothetical protein